MIPPLVTLINTFLEQFSGWFRSMVREEMNAAVAQLTLADAYLTYEEAAAIMRVKPDTVKKWCNRGLIERVRAGAEPRIRRREVDAYMARAQNEDEEGLEDRAVMGRAAELSSLPRKKK